MTSEPHRTTFTFFVSPVTVYIAEFLELEDLRTRLAPIAVSEEVEARYATKLSDCWNIMTLEQQQKIETWLRERAAV